MTPVRYRSPVATFEDAARLAMALPQATEGTRFRYRTWFVGGRPFAWERPFSKADIKRFGAETPPDGPILAVWVGDMMEKEGVLASNPRSFFDIEHFGDFPAILVQLRTVSLRALRDVIEDGWLAAAPPALVAEYQAR